VVLAAPLLFQQGSDIPVCDLHPKNPPHGATLAGHAPRPPLTAGRALPGEPRLADAGRAGGADPEHYSQTGEHAPCDRPETGEGRLI
jgi:hypothetical protein